MTRVTLVRSPDDYPEPVDASTSRELRHLFESLFPGVAQPQFDASHDGLAIAAHNPKLALKLAELSRFMALDLPWCGRVDLRELAIQTVNRESHCEYGFRTRIAIAAAAGVSEQAQEALADWRTSALFDDEQRLVIEYTQAVVRSAVSDELFSRVAARYTEKGAVEFTAVIAFWSFWAMFLNAAN